MISHRSRLLVPAILGLVLTLTSKANAGLIGLHNTGVDDSGVALPGGSADPHYKLISSPISSPVKSPSKAPNAIVSALIPPVYLPNGTGSKWIGPGFDLTIRYPIGIYIYRTTFDLTGFDPTTAVITGNFASDNNATIDLNGRSTGFATMYEGFKSFTPFTLSSGFVSGLNTLDFRVIEPSGSPTGLRVELSGTAETVEVAAAPEPTSLVLAVIGAAGLLAFGVYREWGRGPGTGRNGIGVVAVR